MDIYLEAVGTNGEMISIGTYYSPAVPRISEKILLCLTMTPGSHPYPDELLFRVRDVRYKANNHMQIEDWAKPFYSSVESTSVAILVAPESADAKGYIRRVTEHYDRSDDE